MHLLKAGLEEWQKAAYIQNREMQIYSTLAGMFRLETTSKHVLFGQRRVLNNSEFVTNM